MDLYNNFCKHQYWRQAAVIDAAPCGQAYEIIASLIVAWPTSSDSANGARLHCVVMLLMCLYVLTKFYLAISIEVQLAIEYDSRWALCFGHATLEGKHVAPEYGGDHFYDHNGGKVIK